MKKKMKQCHEQAENDGKTRYTRQGIGVSKTPTVDQIMHGDYP